MYEVTLVQQNLDGHSSSAAAEFHTSNKTLPPPPTNLHVTFINMNSMNVEWYQPSSDIEILHYMIKYYEMMSSDKLGSPQLQTRWGFFSDYFFFFFFFFIY